MKLVPVVGLKLRKRILESVGYDVLKGKKYEIWDVSKCFDGIKNKRKYPDEVDTTNSVIKIKSIKNLLRKIEKEDKTFYILYGIPDEYEYVIKKKVKKEGGEIVDKTRFTNHSQVKLNNVCDERITDSLGKIKSRVEYICRSIRQTINRSINPDYVFVPTLERSYTEVIGSLSTEVVPIHLHDYDNVLNIDDYEEENRAVFLSSDYPHHIEVEINGKDNINKSKYYREIKRYFEYLKEKYSIDEVVISEHPNAFIGRVKEYWGEYKVVKESTAKSVAKSKYVVSMGSNATLYSVMLDKKASLFVTEEQTKNYLDNQCIALSNMFDIRPTVIRDEKIISEGDMSDKSCNKKIFYNYIKEKGTPEVNSFKYMYDYLKGI